MAIKDRLTGLRRTNQASRESALAAAAGWLAAAQNATPDDGAAAWYDLQRSAWKDSYPETTGYIIPTLFDYAAFSGREEFRDRALRMAHWESDIQLGEGGVRAGTIDSQPVAPTVFNTGQVLFGWARAWRETGDERWRTSLVRACEWLVAAQDKDGHWRRFASPFAAQQINSYNTRSAFGLARAGVLLERPDFVESALANVRAVLSRAKANGWLDHNCLDDDSRPLTHTIAYSIRGILEVGVVAEDENAVTAASRMAEAVALSQRSDGALPGRLDGDWRAAARWSCLTGNSQMAINWLRLAEIHGDRRLVDNAERANRFNISVQDRSSRHPGVRGGVKGSHPVDGGYMTYRYPNWAAKFFMDALMLEAGYPADR
ncbi:hypothetical protein SADO_15599 [Salinisphaera dokdonensis CL-ES53]|uniref:Uncharacterized protein n=1 Tax=Salinisphaera dokdonensis CL-ES53 TaxID=1304272 RepID=A0ABV2B4B6_9GAMM